mmetsp:Transcript_28199/g.91355  ORF Transcript_28199/g.91355 Transcript_28199/m.91355 type:complete len:297 (-) Transcript_28199:439-1329(-)
MLSAGRVQLTSLLEERQSSRELLLAVQLLSFFAPLLRLLPLGLDLLLLLSQHMHIHEAPDSTSCILPGTHSTQSVRRDGADSSTMALEDVKALLRKHIPQHHLPVSVPCERQVAEAKGRFVTSRQPVGQAVDGSGSEGAKEPPVCDVREPHALSASCWHGPVLSSAQQEVLDTQHVNNSTRVPSEQEDSFTAGLPPHVNGSVRPPKDERIAILYGQEACHRMAFICIQQSRDGLRADIGEDAEGASCTRENRLLSPRAHETHLVGWEERHDLELGTGGRYTLLPFHAQDPHKTSPL